MDEELQELAFGLVEQLMGTARIELLRRLPMRDIGTAEKVSDRMQALLVEVDRVLQRARRV